MGVLVYLLVIIGSPWLVDAMVEFRESQMDRLVPYVEQPAENVKAGPPCYCIGRTCYYCPGNTYCTVDRTGCCPRPGCRNICCPEIACLGDYPKCCGTGCCTSTSTIEKLCCAKKDLELEEDDRREVKEEGLHLNDDGETSIFKDLCDKFKTDDQRDQYAVLVVGRHELQPKPSPYDSEGLCIGDNYAAAKFFKGGKHTEDIILNHADDMINKYKGKYGENPELFLFSKNSPCCGSPLSPNCDAGCAGKIQAKLKEFKLNGQKTKMNIAWDNNYKLGAMPFDKVFLFSLNSMLSPGNAQLSWNTAGYCRNINTPRKWFQKTMFECLLPTAKGHPSCTSTNVEQDLARLINKVTWICGTISITETTEDEYYTDQLVLDDDDAETFDTQTNKKTVGKNKNTKKIKKIKKTQKKPKLKKTPARDEECWKNQVKSLDSVLLSQLAEKAYQCAYEYKSTDDLGPALNPNDPTTFSNSASDVRGDEYGNLCF